MSNEQTPAEFHAETSPTIRRGKISELKFYEVSESELDLIENGSDNSIFLNFSIFLISTAVSFTITLLTAKITGTLYFMFFNITLVSSIIGVLLFLLWFRQRKSLKSIISKIRERLLIFTF